MRFIATVTLFTRAITTRSFARRTIHASANTTVNSSEIAHFSRLSSLWWDEKGEFGLLHRMNPLRMQFIREKLTEVILEEHGEDTVEGNNDVFQGLDVLDVGCGGGLLSESLARLGATTLGIDASDSNIAIASLHGSADPKLFPPSPAMSLKSPLTYRHISVERLLEEPKRFDVVCSMEVLEHVDNPVDFLSACAELVKPGGHLFLSTIARTALSYLLTIVAAERVFRKVTPGTHTHSKYVNPSELISFFQKYPSIDSSLTKMAQVSQPWITCTYDHGLPTRTEAEVRGIVYVPWRGQWVLMPRAASAWGATECNYLFWVRKPKD